VDSEVDTGIEVLAADDVSRAGAAVCYTYAVTLSGPVQPRDAAAIALHVGGPESRVLWVRRSPSAPFLAGYYDFPSGHAHACDATAPATGGDDVALRVTGLRELFEEAGVLVVEPPATRAQERELREAFARSAEEGTERMRALGLRWDTRRLEPMARWVTPALMPIRFDTRFFALRCDAPLRAEPDGREVDRAELVSAAEALAAWARGEALVLPPVAAALRIMRDRGEFDLARMARVPGADARENLRYEVVPALQLLPLRTPTLPPATHTNAFLVGSRDAVLIEPASPWDEEIDVAVRWVEDNRARGVCPRAILATHHHPDHVGGAVALKERLGLPLWGHALTVERLAGIVDFERTIDDGEVIELDGPEPVSLRAIHTPGHAPGHLCFLEERSGAMIAGDMVASIGTILVEPTDGDMTLYLDSLRRMASVGPSLLLPAHGTPIRDPQAKLDAYVRHRLWREEKVLAALAEHAAPASPEDIVPVAYDDAPKLVWPLAAQAAAAHLLKLERDGRVVRDGAGFRAT